MFGWEFPPYNSGGLGTACYGLTKGLNNHGTKVTFVLPKQYPRMKSDFVKLISADIRVIGINSLLVGYMNYENYNERIQQKGIDGGLNIYGKNLFEEVYRYSEKARLIARSEKHDVIHAHDWMTYQAGIAAKKESKKPLVIHVHATEFDRTGGNPNRYVYQIEKQGMEESDAIIAVSNFTKNKIIEHYGINHEKVHVVHNSVDFSYENFMTDELNIKKKNKIVLFLGRITLQKGPDYFLYAAKKCLEIDPNIKFVFAGSGDMEPFIIEKAAELGISYNVLFAGFLRGNDVDKAYQAADLFVMPSVSEPFGLTALEAMKNKTPVLISKQSGVSEVIKHCLLVDFWDVNELVNNILAVLRYKALRECLREDGFNEVKKFSWNEPARKCIDIYNKVLAGAA